LVPRFGKIGNGLEWAPGQTEISNLLGVHQGFRFTRQLLF